MLKQIPLTWPLAALPFTVGTCGLRPQSKPFTAKQTDVTQFFDNSLVEEATK